MLKSILSRTFLIKESIYNLTLEIYKAFPCVHVIFTAIAKAILGQSCEMDQILERFPPDPHGFC